MDVRWLPNTLGNLSKCFEINLQLKSLDVEFYAKVFIFSFSLPSCFCVLLVSRFP
jgi:hypothetical protein